VVRHAAYESRPLGVSLHKMSMSALVRLVISEDEITVRADTPSLERIPWSAPGDSSYVPNWWRSLPLDNLQGEWYNIHDLMRGRRPLWR
jgi:hypothetical protein